MGFNSGLKGLKQTFGKEFPTYLPRSGYWPSKSCMGLSMRVWCIILHNYILRRKWFYTIPAPYSESRILYHSCSILRKSHFPTEVWRTEVLFIVIIFCPSLKDIIIGSFHIHVNSSFTFTLPFCNECGATENKSKVPRRLKSLMINVRPIVCN